MRRHDKEITSITAIKSVIGKSLVCRLALSEDNRPYVVPLCFGYTDDTLYFHSASEGKKIEILKKNGNVCFEFDLGLKVVHDEEACKWGMRYQSVIGFGKASFVDDLEEKRKGLDAIMENYSSRSFDYPEAALKNTVIIKVEIESVTGKQSGYEGGL